MTAPSANWPAGMATAGFATWESMGAAPAAPVKRTPKQNLLHRRLLSDIAELQQDPYPGITLHTQDDTALEKACLILAPENEEPLHLTIHFTHNYPLSPPEVTMQSAVKHPNIYGSYICASILNTEEGYTSAYTLKGICIQLLSFFSSDTIEQVDGGPSVNRRAYQSKPSARYEDGRHGLSPRAHTCNKCQFGSGSLTDPSAARARLRRNRQNVPGAALAEGQDGDSAIHHASPKSPRRRRRHGEGTKSSTADHDVEMADAGTSITNKPKTQLTDLPGEVLLLICEHLDTTGLVLAAQAWNGFSRLLHDYNLVRKREIQCFVLKEAANSALGVGVSIDGKRIESEFDLISEEAVAELQVRKSVQGLYFDHWLPLPISQAHWARVRKNVMSSLEEIATAAGMTGLLVPAVLYSFMNDIVVRLSQDASEIESGAGGRRYRYHAIFSEQKSTLTHASEKAIESYFHLLHLLVCLAIEHSSIFDDAKATITNFLNGKTDKISCPNLGHLLIMVLISGDSSEALTRAIIKEAVTRNVVWMLDARGAGMPELSFMETDAISHYRLEKTFQASKTSYRLLMFANIMKRCVRTTNPETGKPMTLPELRDSLFTRRGAPPNGAAAHLANSIREIQKIDTFPQFLKAMDVEVAPTASQFTTFLRGTVRESVKKGYSKFALTQPEALLLRLQKEPSVSGLESVTEAHAVRRNFTFFPGGGRGGRRR